MGLVVLAGGLARIAIAGASLRGAAARRHRHAELVRLVGRRQPELGATVVECPDSAVYLIPGRIEEIVVTTGALSTLDKDALAAVLAHERAHACGRHHLPLAAAALLHQAFPVVKAFEHAERQVRRLVEICADDDACRRHSPLALARALVTLGSPAAAAETLAAGGDALERLYRLMDPPPPLARRSQTAAAAVLVALPLVPLAIVLAVPLVPVLAAGPPLW
jgi:Zn-dependent protease with chaperone function